MQWKEPVSAGTMLAALAAATALVCAVVIYFGLRIERALLSTRQEDHQEVTVVAPLPQSAVSAATPTQPTPVSAVQFGTQWAGHHASVAEERCWKPHFARYDALPGHLDLAIRVGPSGQSEQFELVGFKNPDDSPDPALAKQVFDCVVNLLKSDRFPPHDEAYLIQGRVHRPNPPAP
jgi:hypothetical protein